jgi:hypothetical protein
MDKTDDGSDAATFAQHFNQFSPGKKVGSPRIADDTQQAAGRQTPQMEGATR